MWMVNGKAKLEWDHTSLVVSTLLNVNRDTKKSSPVNCYDIHPIRPKSDYASEQPTLSFSMLKLLVPSEKNK